MVSELATISPSSDQIDPLWGPDDIVVRANADTFHVTNRSPQVGFFNMGKRKPGAEAAAHAGGTLYWRALEDFALNNAVADQARVSVFTGPIDHQQHCGHRAHGPHRQPVARAAHGRAGVLPVRRQRLRDRSRPPKAPARAGARRTNRCARSCCAPRAWWW